MSGACAPVSSLCRHFRLPMYHNDRLKEPSVNHKTDSAVKKEKKKI